MSDTTDITVLPVLPSLDLAETRAFYSDKLGLSEVVHAAENYMILRRPGIELYFWLTDDASLCQRTSVYIRGGGIDALHAEYLAHDVMRPEGSQERLWGMKEFYISDPHGNLLRFGRIPVAG